MFRISALGIVLASLLAAGCGGSSGGGSCDVNQLFTTKYGCSGSGCHDAVTKAANFDMTAGFESRLVGVSPPGGGPTFTNDAGVSTPITSLQSMCANMGMHYLDMGSQPATGLFLRKLTATPGCGTRMPQSPLTTFVVSDADLACIQTWANNLTK